MRSGVVPWLCMVPSGSVVVGKAPIASVVGAFFMAARWVHCTSAMYLTNVQRLALHLEGYPDAPLSVVQAAVTATGYTGYVAPDYKAPAPPAPPAPGVKR
jgi:hypothetical protein